MTLRSGRGPFAGPARTTRWLMAQVVIALAPIAMVGVLRHGPHAALLVGACVLGAWLTELAMCRADRRPFDATDASPLVTGLLLALTLPPTVPVRVAVVGACLAIALGKHFTGGLGTNPFNPALLARVLLQWGYPEAMNVSLYPVPGSLDALSAASPLQAISVAHQATLVDLLTGRHASAIGEAGGLVVLACGLYLVARGVVEAGPPAACLGTIFGLALLWPGTEKYAGHAPWLIGNPVYHVLSGGAMLSAFFFVTDPVTTPLSRSGRLAFAALVGAITVLIRFHGPYPEGVAYAVLMANAGRSILDDLTRPRPLGR